MDEASTQFSVADDGLIEVRHFTLPLSAKLSAQAREYQIARQGQPSYSWVLPHGVTTEDEFAQYVTLRRQKLDEQLAEPLVANLLPLFPVRIEPDVLGGVPVEVITPPGGDGNDDGDDGARVLINLHGGSFMSGAVHLGRVESIPLASLGKFRVVAVDYRMGHEHRFPAASEDVTAVYEALLETYPAQRIGIYGGSAGGHLTAQATAWILDRGLPAPGAIGIFGSGGGWAAGDSSYFSLLGSALSPVSDDDPTGTHLTNRWGYLSETASDDPLVNPVEASEEFLARFPPTLFVTGTRAYDLSPAVAFHRVLNRAGVDAALHVFDGLGHCFYYRAFMPEARDAYDTMIRFFGRHLQ